MNEINAKQSGSWSDPSTWGGILPTPECEVYCNGFTVYMDTDVEVKCITNEQTSTAIAGRGQLVITKENCIIQSKLVCESNTLINFNGNKLIILGDVQGSVTTGYTPCIVNTGQGTIEVEGDVRGGDSGYSPGIINQSSGVIKITGLVCNGQGGWSYGIYNEGTGKVIINNNDIKQRYIGDFCTNLEQPLTI